MALIACPDCARQVSNEAPACPQCGRPINAGTTFSLTSGRQPVVRTRPATSFGTWAFLFLILLVIVAAALEAK